MTIQIIANWDILMVALLAGFGWVVGCAFGTFFVGCCMGVVQAVSHMLEGKKAD